MSFGKLKKFEKSFVNFLEYGIPEISFILIFFFYKKGYFKCYFIQVLERRIVSFHNCLLCKFCKSWILKIPKRASASISQ